MTNWRSIWQSLSPEDRIEAALAFWESPRGDSIHRGAYKALASHGGFRRRTLEKMPAEKLARRLATLPSPSISVIQDLVTELYLGPRLACLTNFLDALDLRHKNGFLLDDDDANPPPSQSISITALTSTRSACGREETDCLADALFLLNPSIYSQLPGALAVLQEQSSSAEDSTENASEPESQSDSVPAEAQPDLPETQAGQFTTLDRELIKSMVASVSEIEGALDEDQIGDLVDEVLALNVDRHQSYFHLGFLNGLKSSDASLEFPESNETRRAWYLAGTVSAHARRGEDEKILALLDEFGASFNPLLSGSHDAIPYVLPHLIDALWSQGREAEIPQLTHARAWGQLPLQPLFKQLNKATDLLVNQEPERAEPHLRLLENCINLRIENDQEVPPYLAHTVQRRRAHALRQRGDFAGARKRLLRIEGNGPPATRARVQADLGLLDAGFRSLSRIHFPDQRQDLVDLAVDLDAGNNRFLKSVELAGIDGGHGAYCLALRAIARNDPARALSFAERAEAFFASKPKTYERGGLLARARLILGWALATELERNRCAKASDCLAYAVRELGAEGLYLVEDALAALASLDATMTASLAQDLRAVLKELNIRDEGILDSVAQRGVLLHSSEIRAIVLERAGAAGRSRQERFMDAERLLDIAEQMDDQDLASSAIDLLQGIASRNPGSEQATAFLNILEEDGRISTGWMGPEVLEARLALHQIRGECSQAATLMEGLAHETLSLETGWAVEEARELLIEVKGLGVEGMPSIALVGRIEAQERLAEARRPLPTVPQTDVRGRIIFLGGTEAQGRYAEEIKNRILVDHPKIEIVFELLGWDSNWGRRLSTIKNSLDNANAFVLMRFIRTMCGRQLRRRASELDIPWIPCTGHGKDSVERSIRRAIEVLRQTGTSRTAAC